MIATGSDEVPTEVIAHAPLPSLLVAFLQLACAYVWLG